MITIKILLFLFTIIGIGCDNVPTETNTTITEPAPEPSPSYFPIILNYPTTDTLVMAGSSFTYSVSGGKPPYSFSVTSGPGFVNETSGKFEAGSIIGNSIVEIADSSGQVLAVKVRVSQTLSVSPNLANINITESLLLNVSGGVPPYSFYIENGSGFINGLGFYTSNSTPTSSIVRIYDSQGNNVSSQITTKRPVKIFPNNLTINRGETLQFSASDGFPPYTYQLSGSGTINTSSGEYIAPSISTGTFQVSVTDSSGYKATTNVTVNSQTLSLNSENLTISVNKSFTFKANGGLAPYTFRKISGDGTILASGVYYSFNSPGNDVIQVEDSEHNVVFGNISINNDLSITPNSKNTVPNQIEVFAANGGVPPYSFQIISGPGSINNEITNSNGEFISTTTGTTIVQLRDNLNTIVNATISINPEVQISPLNPKISIGNSVTFIGSGGIPPYEFDLLSGPGVITVGGNYTSDLGVFTEDRFAIVRIRDSKGTYKQSTITITPNLTFSESNIIVKSGSEKIITANGGVPPYTLHFKNGLSLVGSSIQNIPNGSGGYTMKYIAGFVNDDFIERLKITDAYNNEVEQNVSIFGGLVAFIDPDKLKTISSDRLIGINSLEFINNSSQITIFDNGHGLNSSSTIRLKDSASCSNFDDYEFNKRFDIIYNDLNSFFITMNKKSNQSILCGDGNSFKYDVLTNNNGTLCPFSGSLNLLNLRGYSSNEISVSCSTTNSNLFDGSCGKSPGCSNPYKIIISRPSPSDNVFRHINMNIPLSLDEGSFVSLEMWFKWNGDRSPIQVPPVASFNGTLASFNNYNISFMTVLNSSMIATQSLCFNTQISSLDCYGFANPDPLISNRWTHFVFIFNNGDVTKNKIYINGVEKGVSKIGVGNSVSRYVSNDLKIGVNSNNSSDYFRTSGDLGVFRVYDKELPGNVILNNYNEYKCLYQNICN